MRSVPGVFKTLYTTAGLSSNVKFHFEVNVLLVIHFADVRIHYNYEQKNTIMQDLKLYKISGSHDDIYEDDSLLGYCALLIALMMEALRTSETCRSTSTRPHCAISLKTVIFILMFVLSQFSFIELFVLFL
jgi:hypothetical protein